ncbi:MAG: hypothetical protein ACTSQY_00110 [Candidatus Odinarchaeia archaeon]|nr:MAG: hypothetical protein [Lokiarchaeota virus Fenrir Meg22_1012]URC17201.1 MAG: hypothetical protein [Lokiarchaeota virus Fenrir Meg22_1214]
MARNRNAWVLRRAGTLAACQEAAFAGIDRGMATTFLFRLSRATDRSKGRYYQEFLKLLSIANDETNREAAQLAQRYVNLLLNAYTDQQFNRLIIQHASIFNMIQSTAAATQPQSEEVEPPEFVEPPPEDSPEPDPTILQRVANIIKNYVSRGYKILKTNEYVKQLLSYVAPLTTYYIQNNLPLVRKTGTQMFDDLMVAEQSTACVVGVVPLTHVQEIEVARSGRILKFRATGSVFLANQEGGLDAIRVEGYFIRGGIMKLISLIALQAYSTGKRKEISPNMLQGISSLIQLRKALTASNINPLMEKPSYVYHNTFPFVSKHVIIPNVYIETISFEEKVVFGKDVIAYSILMRTYTKPTSFVLYKRSDTSAFYGMLDSRKTKTLRMVEFFVNAARRFAQSQNVLLNEREWKIKYNQAGMDDVYYEIDALDLASSVVLGIIGLKL